jgi:hypothetical protein
MKRVGLAVLVALGALVMRPAAAADPPPPLVTISGTEFYEQCADPAWVPACSAYVIGVIEGWNRAIADGPVLPSLCPPGNNTARQALDIVLAYLRDRPGIRHQPRDQLTVDAMVMAWICR